MPIFTDCHLWQEFKDPVAERGAESWVQEFGEELSWNYGVEVRTIGNKLVPDENLATNQQVSVWLVCDFTFI